MNSVEYAAGDKTLNTLYNDKAGDTLFAVWKANDYKLTLNENKPTTALENITWNYTASWTSGNIKNVTNFLQFSKTAVSRVTFYIFTVENF